MKKLTLDNSGLWFFKGRIVRNSVVDRAWKAYDKAWSVIYEKERQLEAQHRKALDKIQEEFHTLELSKPFMPWVGHIKDGPVESFVQNAIRDWKYEQERREKTHS
jgi:hypothetical protein